jgi:hypothetical protein
VSTHQSKANYMSTTTYNNAKQCTLMDHHYNTAPDLTTSIILCQSPCKLHSHIRQQQ